MRLTRRRFFVLLGACLLAATVCLAGLLHELAVYRAARQTYAALRETVSTTDAAPKPWAEQPQKPDLGWVRRAADKLPGMAAWLRCEGTPLDYPVMQGEDNAFYLSHLADGSENKLGALFLDCGAKSDFSSPVSVIYGHDIKDGQLFGSLSNYKKQAYYDEHPSIELYTPQNACRIELLAAYLEDGTAGEYPAGFADQAAFSAYLEQAAAGSFFTSNARARWGDRLVILSTCTYEFDNARLALVGRLCE